MMISQRDVSRAVLRRFLPSCGITYSAVLIVMAAGLDPSPWLFPLVGGQILGLTAGFGIVVSAGKRLVPGRRSVLGKRTVVAGLLSPLALGAALPLFFGGVFTPFGSLGVLFGSTIVSAAMGALSAVPSFFGRNSPQGLPPEERHARFASAEPMLDRVQGLDREDVQVPREGEPRLESDDVRDRVA